MSISVSLTQAGQYNYSTPSQVSLSLKKIDIEWFKDPCGVYKYKNRTFPKIRVLYGDGLMFAWINFPKYMTGSEACRKVDLSHPDYANQRRDQDKYIIAENEAQNPRTLLFLEKKPKPES